MSFQDDVAGVPSGAPRQERAVPPPVASASRPTHKAAVGGGVLVALAGGARILQLRMVNHRRKKTMGGSGAAP